MAQLEIIEFHVAYPNYNLGFAAEHPLTKTEEFFGTRMILTYDGEKKREYQRFSMNENDIAALKAMLADGKAHIITIGSPYTHQRADFLLGYIPSKDEIRGVCLLTHERVILNTPLFTEVRIGE